MPLGFFAALCCLLVVKKELTFMILAISFLRLCCESECYFIFELDAATEAPVPVGKLSRLVAFDDEVDTGCGLPAQHGTT